MHARRILAATCAVALLAGCTGDDEAPPLSDDVELTTFDDGYLRFEHPAEWELVEEGGGAERRRHFEHRDSSDAEHHSSLIFVAWPVLPGHDLERTVDFFAPDPDSAAVSEFDEVEVDVDGATGAVLQTFVATDAILGDDTPVRFWALSAMSEGGRTVHLLVGIAEGSEYDGTGVGDHIVGSLEIQETP